MLTFGGGRTVTIPAGAPALSDPVDLHVNAVSDVAVSLYLASATNAETTTFLQRSSFVSSAGNFAGVGRAAVCDAGGRASSLPRNVTVGT